MHTRGPKYYDDDYYDKIDEIVDMMKLMKFDDMGTVSGSKRCCTN